MSKFFAQYTGPMKTDEDTMSAFFAQYPGACADDNCGTGRITPGEEVVYSEAGLVHVDCPADPQALELKPTETVCTECWLVQPCEHS